jgi:hypothetical integral membrane protein (TIGR02206 family)
MPANLHLFGLVHLAILAAVPLLALLLARLQRRLKPGAKPLRWLLALSLVLCSVAYYGNLIRHGEQMFPGHIPLELCDISLWITVFALLTLSPALFDLAYYYGIAGASMALLTPNMQEPSLFLSIQFFTDHGLIVVAILYLVWSRQARPRPWSVARAAVVLNFIALAIGTFDALYNTDYMFLRAKPVTVSALDILGPWPWYIVSCEAVGLGLFLLLYLPFRPGRTTATLPPSTATSPQTQCAPDLS